MAVYRGPGHGRARIPRTNRAVYLKKHSASLRSRVVDISEEMAYVFHPESDKLQPKECYYSLIGMISGFEIDSEGRSEEIAKRALHKRFPRHNLDISICSSVPGMNSLPVLETSALKRADVNVYSSQKLVLQIEVQSSTMRETVCRAVYGAADILRLLRFTDESFNNITVLVFPRKEESTCAGMITVNYGLHEMSGGIFGFQCKVKWLTDVTTVWEDIELVLNQNIDNLPYLPHLSAVNGEYLTILSSEELAEFGRDARQIMSKFHVMVESNEKVYKVITERAELEIYSKLLRLQRRVNLPLPKCFVVPAFSHRNVVYYDRLPYGPLEEAQALKYLRTLTKKVRTALEELHEFGFGHGDVRLPNVCFNSNFDAVLIDMERCTLVDTFPNICMQLDTLSCMYETPHGMTGIFTARRMDYMQLGWLLVWVLHNRGDYHKRKWEDLPVNIQSDSFLKRLVMEGEYQEAILNTSIVKDVEEIEPFSSLFNN